MIPGVTRKICPFCKSENRTGAKYCISCGALIVRKENDKEVLGIGNAELKSEVLALDRNEEKILKGRFKLLKEIYSDNNGNVSVAYDLKREREVIVKTDRDYNHDPEISHEALMLFFREGEILSRLGNKYIPRVIKVYYENKHYIVIMKKAEGKSLESYIKEGLIQGKGMPVKNAVKILLALCELIHYLHTGDPPVIHKNIKPSKILINPERKVVLLPWVPRLGKYGSLLGTKGFAAPEQYRGEYDARSDVYGLGAVLYYILSGKDPGKEAPFHFLPLSIVRPDLTGELERVLSKSLHIDPDQRYHSVEEFKDRLFSATRKFFS